MDKHKAQIEIRKLAPQFEKVRLTEHAKKRDPSVGKLPLTKLEIMSCLEFGSLVEGPYQDARRTGWAFTVRRFVDAQKCEVAGVLVMEPDEYILVITGYSVAPATPKRGKSGAETSDDEDEDD